MIKYNDKSVKKKNLLRSIITMSMIFVVLLVSYYSILAVGTLNTQVEEETTVEEITEYLGDEIDTKSEVYINSVINEYFNVLSRGEKLSKLSKYCLDGKSRVEQKEREYREKVSYSYDTNDCSARGIKKYSEYIKLIRVNDVFYKDGTYKAYCDVRSVYTEGLYEYYRSFSADLTFYMSVNEYTYESLTKFIMQNLEHFTPPLKRCVCVLELKKVDGKFYIVDDSMLLNMNLKCYETSLDCISELLNVDRLK